MSEEQIIDDDAPVNTQENVDAPRELTEVEQLAKDMGWDPDYKGSQGKPPRSAQDWIKSTDRRNKNLSREVETLKSSIDRIIDATDKQVKREVQAKAREIEERFAAAVEEGDKQGAAAAARDMRELEAEQQQPAKGRDYEADFARDNPWYGKNRAATLLAVDAAKSAADRGLSAEKQLEAAAAAVREDMPHLFKDADEQEERPHPKTLTVNNPSRTVRQRPSNSFADMPEVARNAANRFYEQAKMRGTAPDRKEYEAQYAKTYFADQAA